MGGPGSGNRYHHHRGNKKDTVEDSLTIDADRWSREGILQAGVWQSGSWCWTYSSGRTCSISYEVQAEEMSSPLVRLSYSWKRGDGEQQSADYAVHLTTTRPTYGGLRWWFVCPLSVRGRTCGRRVAKLHLPPRARYFGCRQCHSLTYRSCQDSHKDDAFARMLAGNMGTDFETARWALRQIGKR